MKLRSKIRFELLIEDAIGSSGRHSVNLTSSKVRNDKLSLEKRGADIKVKKYSRCVSRDNNTESY